MQGHSHTGLYDGTCMAGLQVILKLNTVTANQNISSLPQSECKSFSSYSQQVVPIPTWITLNSTEKQIHRSHPRPLPHTLWVGPATRGLRSPPGSAITHLRATEFALWRTTALKAEGKEKLGERRSKANGAQQCSSVTLHSHPRNPSRSPSPSLPPPPPPSSQNN